MLFNRRDFENIFNQEYFPQLRQLNLSSNLFNSFSIFGQCRLLESVDLQKNAIDSFVNLSPEKQLGLVGLTVTNLPQNLRSLDLSSNQIRDLHGLQAANLQSLTYLSLKNNLVAKIENLENLKSLKVLDLSQNRIRQIDASFIYPSSSFPVGTAVTTLLLNENLLRTLNNVQKCQALISLMAENSRFQDFSDIEKIVLL